MTCVEAEEALLESLDDDLPHDVRRGLDAHVTACASCAEFAARMRALDAHLIAVLPPAMPGPAIAARVRDRQRQDRRDARVASLPDLLHLGGGGAATLLAAALAPADMSWILAAGILCTCATYSVLALMRLSLETIEPDS